MTKLTSLKCAVTGSHLANAQAEIEITISALSDMLCNRGHHPSISAVQWDSISKQYDALSDAQQKVYAVFKSLDNYEDMKNAYEEL